MASEKAVTRSLVNALNSMEGTKAIKLHGSIYSEAGTPDILCVSFNRAFMFEVKKIGGVLSDIQGVRLMEWEEAGVNCLVCFSVVEAIEYLIRFLEMDELMRILSSEKRILAPIVKKAIANFQ